MAKFYLGCTGAVGRCVTIFTFFRYCVTLSTVVSFTHILKLELSLR